ncbi:MAG: MarP family serine protease [Chloroflexota bacterium]|nr:MarP family serine protease [Chloroflexota bacterium]
MNLFDAVALGVFALAVLAGIRTGALPQVGGISGAILGFVVVLNLAPWLLDVTNGLEPIPRALVVLGAALGAVIVGEAIGSAMGHTLSDRVSPGALTSVNRFLGGLLGGAQAILIIWLAGGLLAAGPFPTLARAASQSFAVRVLDAYLPASTEVAGEIAGVLDSSGLPDVFVGLEPVPLTPVDTPSRPETERIARAAQAATARITTRACGVQVNGTGIMVARGYLVTNAHVVAGATAIRVTIGSDVADATAVLFDPALDIALLYAPGLTGTPMRFAAHDPDRGELAAALGYAGGGSLVILPAAITGSYAATGRDIYGAERVTRQILELRAAVEPGDSGGPLVLGDGTIGGLVFAESKTDPDVGYALTPTSVSVRIAPALGRTGAASVGECLR